MTDNIYKIYVTSKGEWEELELDNLNLSTTFSVEELKDISKRKDTISKDIVLKGTKKNNTVFGALYSIDREASLDETDTGNLMYNYKPNKYLDCFVLENNVEIIRGKLLVTSVNIDRGVIYYHCSIVGTVYSFFSEMNERKLEELDYFKLDKFSNIRLNKGYIEDSWKLPVVDPNAGYNIFNSQNTELGGIVTNTGSINTSPSDTDHRYTDYIEVEPNTSYTFARGNSANTDTTVRIATYSSGLSFEDYYSFNSTDTGYTITTGSNVGYLRFSYPRFTNNIKMEEGSSFTGYSDNPEDRPEFLFPMIDYGGEVKVWGSDRRRVERWDVFRPAIYLSSYLKAIFRGFRINSKGEATQYKTDVEDGDYSKDNLLDTFKVEGNFLTEESFRRIFIPNNTNGFTKRISGVKDGSREGVLFKSTISASNINYDRIDNKGYRTPASISNNITINSPYLSFGNKTINGRGTTVLTVATPIKGNIEISGDINIVGSASIYDTFFIARANDGEFSESDFIYSTSITQRADQTTPVSISGVEIEADIADDLVFGVYHSRDRETNTNSTFSFSNVTIWVIADDNTSVEVQYNDDFNVFDTLPKETSVRDFLRNILLTFNLYIITDREDDSILRIYTYDEYYKDVLSLNREVGRDWTNKVDWESYTISSNTSLPRGYKFTYKEDNDVMNNTYKRLWERTYGERLITDSSGLTETLQIESMFSPTINLKSSSDRDIPVIYEGESIFSDDKKQMSSNLRLLYFSGEIITSTEYSLVNARGTVVTTTEFTSYPFSSMNLYSLKTVEDEEVTGYRRDSIVGTLVYGIPKQSWSNDTITSKYEYLTLYNRYYLNQTRELTDINLITVETDIFLNEYDINTLDFRNPIYLQSPYGSAYFKLLKVEYTDSNYPSTVLLQKVVLPDTNRKKDL